MLISVVIPFHNRAPLILRTLHSVQAQTHRPLELLLVDNASTDNSTQVCRQFIEQTATPDFTIRLLNQPRPGASAARNAGLAEARGKYVYFFDSDDEMSPTFLADAAQAITTSTFDPDIIAAATVMHFANGRRKTRTVFHNASVADQVLIGMLSTQSIVVRRQFLLSAGSWEERARCWNDWELGIRLLLHKPHIIWLPRAYHLIYQHPNSLTGSTFTEKMDALPTVLNIVQAQLSQHPSAQQALRARRVILAATLAREGNPQADSMLRSALEGLSPIQHFFFRHLFYPYCRYISRGAWRIYHLFLQNMDFTFTLPLKLFRSFILTLYK